MKYVLLFHQMNKILIKSTTWWNYEVYKIHYILITDYVQIFNYLKIQSYFIIIFYKMSKFIIIVIVIL